MKTDELKLFATHDLYIDYPLEEVMYRWDPIKREAYVKFYGAQESVGPVVQSNRLYKDTILFGDLISAEEYHIGKLRT
ncbi:hypothetical protein H7F33_03515 [Pedobacter sp. PAMC26386]|nr:hypothetical protein H7F33_03515 [Pedobacter sp. PAMC26386]